MTDSTKAKMEIAIIALLNFIFGFFIIHFNSFYLGPVALISSYWLLLRQSKNLKSAVWFSLLMTFMYYLGGTISWLPSMARNYSSASGPAILVICLGIYLLQAISGLGLGLGFWIFSRAQETFKPLLFAISSVAVIHTAPSLITANFGDFVSEYAFLAKALPWIGSLGFHFVWVWVSLELANLIFVRREKKNWQWSLPGIAMLFGLGTIFLPPTLVPPQNSDQEFLAIQTNSGSKEHKEEEKLLPFMQRELSEYRTKTSKEPQFIVTPESAFGVPPYRALNLDQEKYWSELSILLTQEITEKINLPWIGAFPFLLPEKETGSVVRKAPTIAASFLINAQGFTEKIIPKSNLVPFVEYVPMADVFPTLSRVFPWVGGYKILSQELNQQIGAWKIGQLLCYDSLFRNSYWKALEQGTDFLLVLANNRGTTQVGAHSHYLLTRSKSLEYGIPAFFIGNSGLTSFVSTGPIPDRWDERFSKAFAIPQKREPTFYAQSFGKPLENLFFALGIILLLSPLLALPQALKKSQQSSMKVKNTQVLSILVGVILYFLISKFVITIVLVPSESMVPTYQIGDKILVCQWQNKKYKHGDVVSVLDPFSGQTLLKRIFLGPGEKYSFSNGEPKLNGQAFEISPLSDNNYSLRIPGSEKFYTVQALEKEKLWPQQDISVGDNEIFLMGDNRDKSMDSRFFGAVPLSAISGHPCLQ